MLSIDSSRRFILDRQKDGGPLPDDVALGRALEEVCLLTVVIPARNEEHFWSRLTADERDKLSSICGKLMESEQPGC